MNKKQQIRNFWDLIFSFSAIFGLWLWYTVIDFPSSIFSPEWDVIPLFVTLFIVPLGIILIIFSIIRHRSHLKLFLKKPQKAIEYSIELEKPKAGWLQAGFIFGFNLVIFFFLFTFPLEESLPSIPFVGENLKIILTDVIDGFTKLFFDAVSDSGYNLTAGKDFAEKIIMLSVIFSISPVYFLILRLLRIHEKNREKDEGLEHEKRFPGVRILIVFLYIVLIFTIQKIIFDFDALLSIGVNWLLVTILFSLLPMVATLLFHEKITDNLRTN